MKIKGFEMVVGKIFRKNSEKSSKNSKKGIDKQKVMWYNNKAVAKSGGCFRKEECDQKDRSVIEN